ncbi:Stk1 family PASTA domain-containing Ser/Thr kinase [Agromyces sp. ISL-38]|uniref:Stk1 family PASTA domain-containing Ser/Thr kinase n=1 Tax=Agromyces sp. ISL-38 TaxID=2819107 RepID=UPI001BE4F774|nr:Stk1 family PASTA domain-containing Ser/Thr kinase [Agromyces sp. ISL-38]MBT2497790.1 Stk1 family PASTA domain-containing Ser/Thr kinase [Agromyces sp. ISL-38]MBT2517123.1 Stk1 family PASTA domain-containing Ser/Thr kinase [Streptomyces sp. ISL-90]
MSDEGRILAGRYRVGALIGRGGMSDVHVGSDTRLGRQVAIKLLKPQLATDPAFRMRFRQEAQSAARMAHPTIVRVFDAGEETVVDAAGQEVQLPFIVMEFVEGRLLKEIIHDGPLEAAAAVRVIDGVLTALEYSHRAGVVHRDIKPGNIMITTTGQVKVMDFGIARAVSDGSTTVAQTTAILGTASYFSPEQAKGEVVDARTDLYSTGVVLFEMLTGRPPFRGDTPVAVAYQHVSERPVKPSVINPKVSPALDAVVLHALAKDRAERYQSAAEFRTDVDVAASGRVPVHREPDQATLLFGAPTGSLSTSELALRQLTEDETMTRTQRRPPAIWIWSGIIAVVVIVVAVMYWAFNLQPTDDLPSTSREIPMFTGMTFEQAAEQLQELGLPATRIDQTDDTVPTGEVIRTNPAAGEIVNVGVAVSVYVSTGREAVTVPDVRNKNLEQAKADLAAVGLVPGTETRQTSPSVPADTVMGTNPEQGASVEAGSTVDFTLSSGLVTLSDLTGQTLAAASSYLSAENLQLNPVPKPDATCKSQPGSPVTQQSLAPGDVPQHSDVELTYCAG